MDYDPVNEKDKWKYEEPRYIEARISIKKYLEHTRKLVQEMIKMHNDFFPIIVIMTKFIYLVFLLEM